jgi:hypothetical protein
MSAVSTATTTQERRIQQVRDGEIKEMVLTGSLRGKSILRDTDLSPDERTAILETALTLKAMRVAGEPHPWLGGKTLGMIFQHPSTRTRTAFQAGMEQLGGDPGPAAQARRDDRGHGADLQPLRRCGRRAHRGPGRPG